MLGRREVAYAENSACQAIYNVGLYSGCPNALPTAKTTLEIILGHTGTLWQVPVFESRLEMLAKSDCV